MSIPLNKNGNSTNYPDTSLLRPYTWIASHGQERHGRGSAQATRRRAWWASRIGLASPPGERRRGKVPCLGTLKAFCYTLGCLTTTCMQHTNATPTQSPSSGCPVHRWVAPRSRIWTESEPLTSTMCAGARRGLTTAFRLAGHSSARATKKMEWCTFSRGRQRARRPKLRGGCYALRSAGIEAGTAYIRKL